MDNLNYDIELEKKVHPENFVPETEEEIDALEAKDSYIAEDAPVSIVL
jgi:hypothetical protein